MNEKWLIGIIICTVIYVFLDFIKDGYKENAIQNGMNEKDAREQKVRIQSKAAMLHRKLKVRLP